jgi:Tetratricopeptide repeat
MAYFEDLSDYAYFARHFPSPSKNIGWLERGHEFKPEVPSAETLELLWNFCTISAVQSRGTHLCDLCDPPARVDCERNGLSLRLGSSEIRVFSLTGTVYAAPTLIFHYVSVHHYRPPEEFLDAMREGPKPPALEYFEKLKTIDPSWHRTHTTESTQSNKEGLSIYRELAKTNPGYLPLIAKELVMLAINASHIARQPRQAEQYWKEAVQIYRDVSEENPTEYAALLAKALIWTGGIYRDTQRLQEAEKSYDEALGIYRDLAIGNRGYQYYVGMALSHLATIYEDTARRAEAIQARKEILKIRQDHTESKWLVPWH